jgi:hypothetical protein
MAPGRTRAETTASAQSPGSSVGRIDGPSISTRKGFQRKKAYAAAAARAGAATTFREA